jgi:hypothetical protein
MGLMHIKQAQKFLAFATLAGKKTAMICQHKFPCAQCPPGRR